MNRLEKVKQLVQDQRVNGEVQETYNKRLNEGQVFVDRLIEQTEKVLNALKNEHVAAQQQSASEEMSELQLKREVIAKYRGFEKIPFYNEKSDVIPVATASTVLQQLVTEQMNATKQMRRYEESVSQQVGVLSSMQGDYGHLDSVVDDLIEAKTQEYERREHSTMSDPQITVEAIQSALEDALNKSKSAASELNTALMEVLIKYLSFDSFNLSEQKTNINLNVLMRLFKRLMNNVAEGNEFITLKLTPIEISLVQNLAMNEIIIIESSKNNMFEMKLRDYTM